MTSQYTDPGSTIRRAVSPNAVNVVPFQAATGVIGRASSSKGITNEEVIRAKVAGESLSFTDKTGYAISSISKSGDVVTVTTSGSLTASSDYIGCHIVITGTTSPLNLSPRSGFEITASGTNTLSFTNAAGVVQAGAAGSFSIVPFTDALTYRSSHKQADSVLYKNGTALSDNTWSFQKAQVLGTVDVSGAGPTLSATSRAFCLEIDHRLPITFVMLQSTNPTGTVVVDGAFVTVDVAPLAAAFTAATLATYINNALAAHTAYGSDYSSCCDVVTVGAAQYLRITSPRTDGLSDVRLFAFHANQAIAADGFMTTVFGSATMDSATRVELSRYYWSSTAAYTLDYVVPDSLLLVDDTDGVTDLQDSTTNSDPTANGGLGVILSLDAVGSQKGTSNFEESEDYNFSLAYADQVDWSALTSAAYASNLLSYATGLYPDVPAAGSQFTIAAKTPGPDGALIKVSITDGGPGQALTLSTSTSGVYTIIDILLDEGVTTAAAVVAAVEADATISALIGLYVSTAGNGIVEDDIAATALTYTPLVAGDIPFALGTAYGSGPIVVGDTIAVELDQLGSVAMDLVQGSPSDALTALGFNTAIPAAAGRQKVCTNINLLLSNDSRYGARYQAAATADSSGVNWTLTSPYRGDRTSIALRASNSSVTVAGASAMEGVFGYQDATTDAVVDYGSGQRPIAGARYFVSYHVQRPASDYVTQKTFTSFDDVKADLGYPSSDNPLVVAAQVAFRHGAPFFVCVQVDDSASPGVLTRQMFTDALAATESSDLITDLVPLTDGLPTNQKLGAQLDFKDHIESMSSETVKKFRNLWLGADAGTPSGDRDTPDTFTYLAARSMQFAPTSPGRGRVRVVAHPQEAGGSLDVQLADGSIERVQLSSEYWAVAAAARRSSVAFGGPAESLANSSLIGFNIDDITSPWQPQERWTMAQNGVMVVTYDAGNFVILDPVTTEMGGARLPQFAYDNTMPPADLVSRRMDAAIKANLKGVVPEDLGDFILQIQLVHEAVLLQCLNETPPTIAPFTDENGQTREIDITRDIRVFRDAADPTRYKSRYWFNLRYLALRFDLVYSVDNSYALSVG